MVLARPSGDSLGGPLSVKPKALFVGQMSVQEAGPGVAWGCLTAWGFPPFPGRPLSPSFFPVGFSREDTECKMDAAPATGLRRSEKGRFFWITEETSKQAGAKCSEQMTELSLPRYQLAGGPARSGPTAAARPGPLGKRNSNFPDLVVLPQRMGTAAASGLGAGDLHP